MTTQHVPARIASGIARYADHGILPGSMLRALIEGESETAYIRADDEVRANWDAVQQMVIDRVPAIARGSDAAVVSWSKQRGLLFAGNLT